MAAFRWVFVWLALGLCVALAAPGQAVASTTVKVDRGLVDPDRFRSVGLSPTQFFNDFFVDNWAALSMAATQTWTGAYRAGGLGMTTWLGVSTFEEAYNRLTFTGTIASWVRAPASAVTGYDENGEYHVVRAVGRYLLVQKSTTFSFVIYPHRDPPGVPDVTRVGPAVAAPGPVAGAGLPVLGAGAALLWRMRRGRSARDAV